ncbi:phenoloxidase-activating factor 3-like [Diorhabda carinulata]|uniref:phenoloxidase-activating factor 3-like n=1 Tax=Diorhabda carinulata TaxID=1163345 RepID=UPI0025A1FF82|nr:phenoloxidase-activating factor 3-like [Diorhabda carinulata]
MGYRVNFSKLIFKFVIFIIGNEISGVNTYESTNYVTTFCPSNTQCVPLSSCPIIGNIISSDCLLNNNVAQLSCGYRGSGLICCPQIAETTTILPGRVVDGQRCGMSQVQGEGYEGIGAYPWIGRIGFRNALTGETKFPCTGSIIDPRIILTAAHCALAKADNFKLHMVRVGEYNTNTNIDCGEEFCGLPTQDLVITHVIVHPGYKKETFENNVALLVLRTPMNFTVTAQPICLPESWSVTSNNGLLVGWGKAAGQTYALPKQQVLHLPIVSIQQCVRVYGGSLPVTEDQICAGGEAGNDACSGFGGAPLLVRHGNTYYQVGILSFGSDRCGSAGIPSVYTNIKKYVNWIRETMQLY